MPEIGDIKKAGEIERKGHENFIFHACLGCGKTRWVRYAKGKTVSDRCIPCAMRLSNKKYIRNSKGGRIEEREYIAVRLKSEDFFPRMKIPANALCHNKTMFIYITIWICHNKTMFIYITIWICHLVEVVHHKNADGHDNRIDNLMLTTQADHRREHAALNAFAKSTKGTREVPGVRIFNDKTVVVRPR